MSKELKIIIEIDEDNQIHADAINFKGDLCLKELNKLLEDLPPIKKVDKKPDFFDNKNLEKINTKSKQQIKH